MDGLGYFGEDEEYSSFGVWDAVGVAGGSYHTALLTAEDKQQHVAGHLKQLEAALGEMR